MRTEQQAQKQSLAPVAGPAAAAAAVLGVALLAAAPEQSPASHSHHPASPVEQLHSLTVVHTRGYRLEQRDTVHRCAAAVAVPVAEGDKGTPASAAA